MGQCACIGGHGRRCVPPHRSGTQRGPCCGRNSGSTRRGVPDRTRNRKRTFVETWRNLNPTAFSASVLRHVLGVVILCGSLGGGGWSPTPDGVYCHPSLSPPHASSIPPSSYDNPIMSPDTATSPEGHRWTGAPGKKPGGSHSVTTGDSLAAGRC